MCDFPEVSTRTEPRARKDYVCVECEGRIAKGEKHECFTGLWPFEDGFQTYRTCMDCVALRCEHAPPDPYDCIPFGGLREYFSLGGDQQALARMNAVRDARNSA